jgi:protein gp37
MKTIPNIEEVILDYPEFTGIHPIANAFPMKPDDEFWELVEHIGTIGVAEKLMREKGTGLLIDGRNRLLAVSITQSLFEIEDIEPDLVLAFVTAKNLHAKKFDAGQRAIIAARLRPFYDKLAKDRQVASGEQFGRGTKVVQKVAQPMSDQHRIYSLAEEREAFDRKKARDEAGKAAGVNHKYVDDATKIQRASSEVADQVLNGKITLQEGLRQVAPIIAAAKAERLDGKPPLPAKEKAEIITADGRRTEIDKPSHPTFNTTNDSVSWANWTWNPVTGCNHGCKFCYAREIANSDRMAAVYPFQFAPAFHDYRLTAPANTKRKNSDDPRDGRVFVCSMADLFGKWVPEEWIHRVFHACAESPEWEYLFLTKWPKRYSMLASLPKAWFGASIIKQGDVERVTNDMTAFDVHDGIVRWISLEPMLEPIVFGDLSWCDLVVIGAQTSTRQPEGFVPEFAPNFEWVADVVAQCRAQGVPYYLKPNLATAPGMNLTQMEPRRK